MIVRRRVEMICKVDSMSPRSPNRDLGHPASLHKYLYANAEPVDLADPTGRSTTANGWFSPNQRQLIEYGLVITLVGVASEIALKQLGCSDSTTIAVSALKGPGGFTNVVPTWVCLATGTPPPGAPLPADTGTGLQCTSMGDCLLPPPPTKPVDPDWPDGYPDDDGFEPGTREPGQLNPGDCIDRYGGPGGKFVAPEGTPFAERSLPASYINRPLNSYTVNAVIDVDQGLTAPWVGQPGGGIQYMLPDTVGELSSEGILTPGCAE